MRLPRPADTVFIANPDIADLQSKSPSILYVHGKRAGETVLYAVDRNDQVLLNARVRVSHNLSQLRRALDAAMPGNQIEVRSAEGTLILTGIVTSGQQAEDARRIARRFVASDAALVNQLQLVAPNQINLRVRIAEVARTSLRELGVNSESAVRLGSFLLLFGVGADIVGNGAGGVIRNNSGLGSGVVDNIFGQFRNRTADVNALIDALAQEGLVTVLAEPNLTALTGETANFLAGGEFPIVVPQSSGGGVPVFAVQYRRFGVSLDFTPSLIEGDRINLRVRPEVSELSQAGAVQINSISIPALTTRRAETTVELGSGQSFAIAGLLQNNTRQELQKFPFLGDVPIIGALLTSDRFRRNETELVIVVTPYVVRPVSAQKLASPLDDFVAPNDVERILTGATFRQRVGRGAGGPRDRDGEGLRGPAGFILE
ncbi:MAG: type II and III secretion system protein family protein [Alphaproteobacteria bacterium]|nr:type II and III secretion system protein family protein [Alphaproteobacteria bacterium]